MAYGLAAATNASSAFSAMNHTSTASTTVGKTAILANLPTYTVFYIWTHGLDLPSVFGDCFAFPNSTDTNYLYARAADDSTGAIGVTQSVASKPVSTPPYNFAFCDACLTSQNGLMAGAFGVTTSSADLSYLGYTTESDDSQHNADWSNRALTDLSQGLSIGASQSDANSSVGFPILNGQHATTYIWGDKGAKLHGVCGGTGTQWFK